MDPLDGLLNKRVSSLLQEFEGHSFPSTLPRTCQETNIISSLLQEWGLGKEAKVQYEIIACIRVLDVLGIKVVTGDTIIACLKVCARSSWRKAFLSGRVQKSKDFLLHVATVQSIPNPYDIYRKHKLVYNKTALYSLLPKIHNKNMIVCFLRIAVCNLNRDHIRLISRSLNSKADTCFKQCVNKALCDGEWHVVDRMLRVYDVDKTTLHEVLVKAMELREWKVLKACLEQGGDITTACTNNGFDLNARSGESKRTVLHDAIVHKDMKKETVQALLQAGADPNVPGSDGGTAVRSAVFQRKWNFALLLFKHCRAAGITVSPIIWNGEPCLHDFCRRGLSDLVQELLATQTDPLATDSKGNTLIMAALCGADGENTYDEYVTSGSERENVMRVLIQSGVATHQALFSQSQLRSLKKEAQNVTVDSFQSPMWKAVKKRKLRIARMLYAAGACCFEEIHELVNSEFIGKKLEESKNWCDIMAFLNNISSHPRSLQDICGLKISHLIGCAPQRDVRAASLGLPDSLRRRVLQDHVISSDFLKDYPPDPEDSRRIQPRLRRFSCCYGAHQILDKWRRYDCSCQI